MEDAAAPAAPSAPPAAPSSSPPPPVQLETCTAAELSSHLLTRRFNDDAVKTAAFLLECAASLPDSGAISDAFLGGGGGDVEQTQKAEQNGDAPQPAGGGVPIISPAPPSGTGARTPPSEDDGERIRRRIGDPLRLSSRPGSPELSPVEVSSVSPRGRFTLRLHERGFTLTNPKKPDEERIVVTSDSLTDDWLAIVFPRPEKCSSRVVVATKKKGNKKPEELVRLLLVPLETFCEEGEAVTFRKKVLKQVCLPLPVGQAKPGDEEEVEAADGNKASSATLDETDWIDAFRTSLSGDTGNGDDGGKGRRRKKTRVVTIDYPQCRGDVSSTSTSRGRFVFRSDGPSTNPRMPFVGCYHGVNQGSLFPLEEGLLYFKPPLFLPRSDLRSIGCGRGTTGSGGSTSRYVDMHITLHGRDGDDDGDLEEEDAHETVEFTNISRDELNPLSNYIDNILTPAMARDASQPSPDGSSVRSGDSEDEGREDEEVETSTGGDGTRRRSRREASAHAREATRAQILAADAVRRRRNPQEEEDVGDDDDDDSEEGEEDYNVEDDLDSDEDEDHFIDEDGDDDHDDNVDEDNRLRGNGKGGVEDDDDDDDDFDDEAVDDDETVSDDSGSDDGSEDDPPMKKARKD